MMFNFDKDFKKMLAKYAKYEPEVITPENLMNSIPFTKAIWCQICGEYFPGYENDSRVICPACRAKLRGLILHDEKGKE